MLLKGPAVLLAIIISHHASDQAAHGDAPSSRMKDPSLSSQELCSAKPIEQSKVPLFIYFLLWI